VKDKADLISDGKLLCDPSLEVIARKGEHSI
jgi:hypothetical protein